MIARQRALLFMIHDSIVATGQAPDFNEMMARLGVTLNSVSRHLDQLVTDGFLARKKNYKRGYSVLKLPGRGLLAVEVAWCHANPERVRAMMAICGATVSGEPLGSTPELLP